MATHVDDLPDLAVDNALSFLGLPDVVGTQFCKARSPLVPWRSASPSAASLSFGGVCVRAREPRGGDSLPLSTQTGLRSLQTTWQIADARDFENGLANASDSLSSYLRLPFAVVFAL